MFAIIQIDSNHKELVGYVSSQHEYEEFVKNKIIGDFSIITNLSLEEFKVGNVFKQGRYIIVNNHVICYVEKVSRCNLGYLFDTHTESIKILTEWELIQISHKLYHPLICDESLDSLSDSSDVEPLMEVIDNVPKKLIFKEPKNDKESNWITNPIFDYNGQEEDEWFNDSLLRCDESFNLIPFSDIDSMW